MSFRGAVSAGIRSRPAASALGLLVASLRNDDCVLGLQEQGRSGLRVQNIAAFCTTSDVPLPL